MPLFCWFHHFLDSRADICQIFRWYLNILVQTMTPKGHFEINWPLISNPLDLNGEKNSQEQPTFLAYCSLRNSDYKQGNMLLVPGDFFSQLKSSGLDISNFTTNRKQIFYVKGITFLIFYFWAWNSTSKRSLVETTPECTIVCTKLKK